MMEVPVMVESEHAVRYAEYLDMLNMTYSQAVDYLLKKYGPGRDDYFREKSYQRFLAGEIKSIAKGKYARSSEGLYTHHVDENHAENLGNLKFIRHYQYPFSMQQRDRLVYADLIEHLILHAIIVKETDGRFGDQGYSRFLAPMVRDWYAKSIIPGPDWMKVAYQRSFLTKEETEKLLKRIDQDPRANVVRHIRI